MAASGVLSRLHVNIVPPHALPHRFVESTENSLPLSQPGHPASPPVRLDGVYGVPMEVERKFVVTEAPGLDGAESADIEQGYLAIGSEGEVRVRRMGEKLLLTAKRGSG